MSAGLVVGYVSSLIYLRFLAYRVDRILARERVDIWAYLGMLIGLAIWCFWKIFQYAKKQRITWQKTFMVYLLIAGGLNLVVFCYSFIRLLAR